VKVGTPTKVGRYEILEIIGVGAHGRVARAFDPLIARIVAIKLLPKELAQGAARQRFVQEARVVGQISHTAVMTLHDMGVDEPSETPYLVFEFIKGQPLDKIIEKGSVPFSRACAWGAEVASALAVAHRKGVIHGDVKPANILITEEDRVKLTDFGMARLASRDSQDTPLLGSPAYWCPEQILGKPQDARSDIFSLGVVMYEMVTGHRPFDAESLQGICARVLSSTPLPPSHANPSVPAAFNELIASCLAKDPAQRCASADTVAEKLHPLARRPAGPQQAQPTSSSLRDRVGQLLRSA
jgi:eukaryotic-like serine/threonine-protein kinase